MQSQFEPLLRERRLDEALAALQDEVRGDPSDARKRVALFQLLCVLGRWERAATQLKVAADLDPANALMGEVGRQALACEAMREAVFAGERTPLIFGEPAEWLSWMVQASRLVAQGEYAAAASLRDDALETAPAVGGEIDGERFEWLADADARLGPIVEAYIEGRYYWVPLMHVRQLEIEAPSDLQDFVWAPGYFTWANEGKAAALLPVRYPGSQSSEDAALRLAHATDWQEPIEGTLLGVGQRTFMTDVGYRPMLETRRVTFDASPEAPDAQAAETPGATEAGNE